MRTLFAALLIASPALAGNSNSLIDVTPDGTKLVVANTDSGTVSVVDLKTRKKMAEFKCGDHPEGVSWVGDNGIFLATVYGDDKLRWYDAEKGHIASLKVDDEPYGVVVTKDGKFAYVTHDYPGTVSEIDVAARKVLRSFKVGTGVRGIALGHDEKTLYVSEFFTTNLIGVDRASGKVTDKWPGFGADNLARSVTLHPKRPKAYLAHSRSIVDVFDSRGSIAPQLSIADLWEKPAGEKRRRSIAMDTFNGVYVMANPWESALSPDGKKLYVIFAGTDDMSVVSVLDDDYREIERTGRRSLPVGTGKHPIAVRVSPDGKEVYVYNSLDYEIGVYDEDGRRIAGVTVCDPPHTAEWRRGKELFETARQPMGSARWISCSGCHPSGLTDGRTWQNPEGNRKTPNLFGLAHTHPLHWSADRDEVQDFEFTIQGKLMRGRGLTRDRLPSARGFEPIALDHKLAGKSRDLDAMAVYTNSFKVRLSPHIPEPGKLFPEAERGKKLFFSKETNCATCHSGAYFTDGKKDRPFVTHDVGTGGDKREKMGPKYDTPTLMGVYRVHSYLHDGRAATLMDVLTTHNTGDKHGKTSHLKKEELEELVAFLKSLPYETPPDQTPNTVKDYLKDMAIPRPEEK